MVKVARVSSEGLVVKAKIVLKTPSKIRGVSSEGGEYLKYIV